MIKYQPNAVEIQVARYSGLSVNMFGRLLMLWVVASAPFPTLNAQPQKPGVISGHIQDRFGKRIEGASVSVVGKGSGSSSEADGSYRIDGVPAGRIRVEAQAMGYAPLSKVIQLAEGASVTCNFELIASQQQLGEVSVSGQSVNQRVIREIRQSGFSVSVLNLNDFANKTVDINQVLRQASGVLIRENGGMGSDFTFQINGLAAKIYIDDVPMDQYGSSMTLNNIPVNLVDRVEVYKGVVPAHLGGDAMGGAVNIVTKQRTRRFLDASYSLGSFNTHQAAITGSVRDQHTGLKLRASMYYNHSDNDYTMYSDGNYNIALTMVRLDPETGDYRQVTIDRARRFHDRYRSAMGELEAGVEKVSWADWFTVGLTYSGNDKQNQLGATVNSVYGGNWTTERYWMPALKYRKDHFLVRGLHANIYANYAQRQSVNRDTARFRYDWSGGWLANAGSREADPVHSEWDDRGTVLRSNFTYALDSGQRHQLNLNYTFSTTKRRAYDRTQEDSYWQDQSGLPKFLGKHVVGLTWQGQWISRRLITSLAAKYYGMDTRITLDERVLDGQGQPTGGAITRRKNFFSYPSMALALRYRLLDDAGIKASVERGYNLPETTALFGDGQFVRANYDLKPERSDNANVGVYYNRFFGNHFVNIDLSGFYRDAKDYIASRVLDDNIHYQSQNFPGVKLYGLEAETKYGFRDFLSVSANISYDRAYDNWKYTGDNHSQVSITYGEQLPNRPWIYGNIDVMLAKKDLFKKDTRLQLNYLYQYVHWFYLTWEKLGYAGALNYVPTQTVHSAVLTYSWRSDRYNLSAEARNLTDDRLYDHFRLQRPGRAFYLKFRVSIM